MSRPSGTLPDPATRPHKMSSAPRRPLSSHGSVSSISSLSSICSVSTNGSTATSASFGSTATGTSGTAASFVTASSAVGNGRTTPAMGHTRTNSTPLLASTHKKYKAPISVETRKSTKPPPTLASDSRPVTPSASSSSAPSTLRPPNLATVPASPRSPGGAERTSTRPKSPLAPTTPQAESPLFEKSEMDVSMVDPESVLVDADNLDEADADVSFDAAEVNSILTAKEDGDFGSRDRVMVSVRVRPSTSTSTGPSTWMHDARNGMISLNPAYIKGSSIPTSTNPSSSSSAHAQQFKFDAILTGPANKPIYNTTAKSHVHAAMEGYNSVIFAYGQTASGKTYTLSGSDEEPGIIPRAMREVFGYIKCTPGREYLLRCSYIEIYNEAILDLLAPASYARANPVQIQGGRGGADIILSPLREEVVISWKGVVEVLRRGEANRRTASTDWNERSSRSHSVFRMVIESREREEGTSTAATQASDGRTTPAASGRQTPGGTGSSFLQARNGKAVRTSVLSLIDLAGSEKATSDKERTREGKYINTSLLTLGTVIGTLADSASGRAKPEHVPYRNSKLTRMLQPSLSGNARISVVCTINPDASAISETMSTLLFAKRVGGVKLHAQKKEVIDTETLLEKYRTEIADLKARLTEREAADKPGDKQLGRRLSARERMEDSKALRDLNSRIQQLTKLILTSSSVDDAEGSSADGRPVSPVKKSVPEVSMSLPDLEKELLAARRQLETQASQILSLENAIATRPKEQSEEEREAKERDAEESAQKDSLIASQAARIRALEDALQNASSSTAASSSALSSQVAELTKSLQAEQRKRAEADRFANELVRALEKEKRGRKQVEDEKKALNAFVEKFDEFLNAPRAVASRASTAGSVASLGHGRPPSSVGSGPAPTAYQRRLSRRASRGHPPNDKIGEEESRSRTPHGRRHADGDVFSATSGKEERLMDQKPVFGMKNSHRGKSVDSGARPTEDDGIVDEWEVERDLLNLSPHQHSRGGVGKSPGVNEPLDKENFLPPPLVTIRSL